tara:strand:+ start:2704 stop:3396 length:693 start_codon:yes stop_codon:yes gene_type:complete
MDSIQKVKSLGLWIFIIPFVAVNTCLILITQFHGLFPNPAHVIHNTFPYFDGGASISRTARVFPTYLVFKPAMIFTAFLLIKYWIYNKKIISSINKNHKNIRLFVFFGISSAIFLILHSIFLGIKFDNDFYKLFRRLILLSFIIFEITAQFYLVSTIYSLKQNIFTYLHSGILKTKLILVSSLIIVAIISIPLISLPGNTHLKHALEWDYFLGVIFFYFLTFLMWKERKA